MIWYGSLLPVVGQVVKATLDEAHPDLSVSEPTDERTQQLLCFINQTLGQMNLKTHAANKQNKTMNVAAFLAFLFILFNLHLR